MIEAALQRYFLMSSFTVSSHLLSFLHHYSNSSVANLSLLFTRPHAQQSSETNTRTHSQNGTASSWNNDCLDSSSCNSNNNLICKSRGATSSIAAKQGRYQDPSTSQPYPHSGHASNSSNSTYNILAHSSTHNSNSNGNIGQMVGGCSRGLSPVVWTGNGGVNFLPGTQGHTASSSSSNSSNFSSNYTSSSASFAASPTSSHPLRRHQLDECAAYPRQSFQPAEVWDSKKDNPNSNYPTFPFDSDLCRLKVDHEDLEGRSRKSDDRGHLHHSLVSAHLQEDLGFDPLSVCEHVSEGSHGKLRGHGLTSALLVPEEMDVGVAVGRLGSALNDSDNSLYDDVVINEDECLLGSAQSQSHTGIGESHQFGHHLEGEALVVSDALSSSIAAYWHSESGTYHQTDGGPGPTFGPYAGITPLLLQRAHSAPLPLSNSCMRGAMDLGFDDFMGNSLGGMMTVAHEKVRVYFTVLHVCMHVCAYCTFMIIYDRLNHTTSMCAAGSNPLQ